MSGKIKVLLADDHPLMTQGLKLTIGGWEEFEVVGIAADGAEAVQMCQTLKPDIAVLDMQMPRMSGPEAVSRIKKANPQIRIAALTTFDDAETVREAMDAGCNGFLLKVIEPEKLRSSLLSIAGGLNVYDEEAMAQLKQRIEHRENPEFTQRELEVLGYVCEGMTNAQIAGKIGLRTGTVKNMLSLLLSKTGCVSRAQLARYAADRQLIG